MLDGEEERPPARAARAAGAPAEELERPPVVGRRCSCRTATWSPRGASRCTVMTAARARPRSSGRTCCSPGGSAGTSAPTRSCSRAGGATIGIGAGQMSRVDAVRIAVEKARARPELLRARSSPPTPSSRSPTAPSSRSRRVSRRSSSRAARSATRRSWPPLDAAGAAMVATGSAALPSLRSPSELARQEEISSATSRYIAKLLR